MKHETRACRNIHQLFAWISEAHGDGKIVVEGCIIIREVELRDWRFQHGL